MIERLELTKQRFIELENELMKPEILDKDFILL